MIRKILKVNAAGRVEEGSNSLSFGNSSWGPGHNFSLILHSAFRPAINILYVSSQVSLGELHITFSSRKMRFPCITTIKHFAAELSQAVNHTAAFAETQPIRRTPRRKLKVKILQLWVNLSQAPIRGYILPPLSLVILGLIVHRVTFVNYSRIAG